MRFASLIILFFASSLRADPLWDMKKIASPPKVEWVDQTGELRQLYYSAEPYQGKPTRVFAYYAEPAKAEGKLPAMVLVHGGGGTAFKEWAQLWAKRGYIAIAMDLAGVGPDGKRLADGGPPQDDGTKFPEKKTDLKEIWTYHAIADVILAHSLLRSLPNVDVNRIGVTGISWGGYLTCIVAGVDDRFKLAVPVYGCGFLHENSVWLNRYPKMESAWRQEWIDHFDPSSHIKNARMPMLFVNGTNDFAYPLDSYQKTYRLVKDRTLCITVNMPHGHQQGWAPTEIGEFADAHFKKGKPFLQLDEKSLQMDDTDGRKRLLFSRLQQAEPPVAEVRLHFTENTKEPWQKRKWQTVDLHLEKGRATDLWSVELPKPRPIVWFVTIKDKHGRTVSSEHALMEK